MAILKNKNNVVVSVTYPVYYIVKHTLNFNTQVVLSHRFLIPQQIIVKIIATNNTPPTAPSTPPMTPPFISSLLSTGINNITLYQNAEHMQQNCVQL